MAQRRMFSLKIIDTDMFLEMPQSTRLLYYELCMRADDDGFVASPKKIMRMTGCSQDDYNILLLKQYIIPFDSGICVIKHWRIHNLIRSDRYTETEYKQEKSMLLDIDSKYEVCSPNVIPIDTQVCQTLEPQDRLGEDRLGEDRLGEDMEATKVADHVPYAEIVELFNSSCTSLSRVITLNKKRKDKIKVRWGEIKDLETFRIIFNKAQESNFLKGGNKSGWKCSFDWIIENDNNYVKVLEGQYKNKEDVQRQDLKELYQWAQEEDRKEGSENEQNRYN